MIISTLSRPCNNPKKPQPPSHRNPITPISRSLCLGSKSLHDACTTLRAMQTSRRDSSKGQGLGSPNREPREYSRGLRQEYTDLGLVLIFPDTRSAGRWQILSRVNHVPLVWPLVWKPMYHTLGQGSTAHTRRTFRLVSSRRRRIGGLHRLLTAVQG